MGDNTNNEIIPVVQSQNMLIPTNNVDDDSVPLGQDTQDDIEYARKKLKELIDGGQETFDAAVELATESESPNAIRAVAELLRANVEALDKLGDVHVKRTEMQHPRGRRAPVKQTDTNQFHSSMKVNDSVVYVGTPAELLTMVKNQQENGPILLNEEN